MHQLKILDVDLENRPLAYLGADYTTAEITALAACWHGRPSSMRVWVLGRDRPLKMLDEFVAMFRAADMVTGHYIRVHDLPVINGALLEYGRPPLPPKLTCDTKLDLVKRRHLSTSQENLCAALGVRAQKVHMSNAAWREANRLTSRGIRLTRARVIGDVLQHMKLREALVARGLLREPRVWRS